MTKAKQLILPISYPDSGRWYAPVRKIKIDERTYALRMGEPVQLGTVKEIEKEFRVGRRVLARLADIGVIERVRPSPFNLCTTLRTLPHSLSGRGRPRRSGPPSAGRLI